ncbi:MAG: hypothetical protein ACUZ77_07690 [Candidatus Brocadiales bacterium]
MKFKVMEWIRKVRDEDYEKCKTMSSKEKIGHTKRMAKEFEKKFLKTDSTAG